MAIIHLPVMSGEVIAILAPQRSGIYIDATAGLGGHSEMILSMIGQDGKVVGLDRDEQALAIAAQRLNDSRVMLRKIAFSGMQQVLGKEGISGADGVLFDLGVSMMQIKDPERGFSFLSNERLDMRMDKSEPLTAWDVVNTYPESELARIIREYGEEFRAARIARSITAARAKKTIDTCSELADLVSRSIGRSGRTHPATKTFQALRIALNRELDELKAGLSSAVAMLKPGGRLCVISYHSLEDRIVKNFIRENAKAGLLLQLTKKPLVPTRDEMRQNPSSRSAKLRGAEKL